MPTTVQSGRIRVVARVTAEDTYHFDVVAEDVAPAPGDTRSFYAFLKNQSGMPAAVEGVVAVWHLTGSNATLSAISSPTNSMGIAVVDVTFSVSAPKSIRWQMSATVG